MIEKVVCEHTEKCTMHCDHKELHEKNDSCNEECRKFHDITECIPVIENPTEWKKLDPTNPKSWPDDLIVSGHINNEKYEFYLFNENGNQILPFRNRLSEIRLGMLYSFCYDNLIYDSCNYRLREIKKPNLLNHLDVFDKWFKISNDLKRYEKITGYSAKKKEYYLSGDRYTLDQLNQLEWHDNFPPKGI